MIIPAIAIKLSSLGLALFAPHTEILGERAFGMPSWMSPENPNNQLQFILGNIPAYIGILLKTIFVFKGNDYLVSFIGNLGWLDTPLPSMIIIPFYILLFFTAIGNPTDGIKTRMETKNYYFGLFHRCSCTHRMSRLCCCYPL